MRALITEDSKLYRQILENIFGQLGFQTDVCNNIASACRFVDTETYAIICVNHHLKDGNGTELIQYCNSHDINQKPLILYLTSSLESEHLKPFHIDQVIYKQDVQQLSNQITRFVEKRLDPIFSDGRILFVEDSKSISALICSHLTEAGYRVSHHNNAEQAWREFDDEPAFGSDSNAFDLIITDINLKGNMTGDELLQKVRKFEDARGYVPVIAITGETRDELRLSLYRKGINDFLQKPILPEELLLRVGNLITNKRLLDKVHDQRRELYTLATTDKLTGCHNRHSLMEYSKKMISQAQRHKYPVSLMVIDLDYFKVINDNHGHVTGDAVLSEIGKLLLSSFREDDLVARFGGEEFVVMLGHCDAELALLKAEEFRQKVESLTPMELKVTCSIGLATKAVNGTDGFEAMFSKADKAVYQAKERGRNQVVFS